MALSSAPIPAFLVLLALLPIAASEAVPGAPSAAGCPADVAEADPSTLLQTRVDIEGSLDEGGEKGEPLVAAPIPLEHSRDGSDAEISGARPYHDLEPAEAGAPDQEEDTLVAEDAQQDGEGRFFADVDAATAVLMQEARVDEEAALQTLLKEFQASLDAALAADGEAVVGRLDMMQLPCPEKKYLHETFVHADMRTATFVCKPCHAACASRCSGSGEADCWSVAEPASLTSVSTVSKSEFAKSFAAHFAAQWANVGNGSDDDAVPENMTQCILDGTCSMSVDLLHTSSSPNMSSSSVELVWATSLAGNLTEPVRFKSDVQRKINEALQQAGFMPGVTEELVLEDEIVNTTDANEDGAPSSEATDAAQDILQSGSLLELQRSCEAASEAKMNRTLRALSSHIQYLVKKVAKDHVKVEAKRRANDYAKANLKAWVQAQDGDCLDALDGLVGAVQRVYACFKDNYHNVKYAFCKPADDHELLTRKLQDVLNSANTMKTITAPFTRLPYVGGAASTMYNVASRIRTTIDPRVRTLKAMKVKQYGSRVREDASCCMPFPDSHCKATPGAMYRCASCSGGSMCVTDRGCNTLQKMEDKVDKWKAKYYDPIVVKIAEAVQYTQAANNAVHKASWLARCGQGLNTCSKVKALADKISGSIAGKFTDKYCPLKAPRIPFPNISPISVALDWLGKIAHVFRMIQVELGRVHCVSHPMVDSWWETQCHRVCTPCCSYHGRRRWTGGVRCRSCCHNVCVKVLKQRFYTKRYCFSALNILKGMAGFVNHLLGPINNIIKAALNRLLQPVVGLFNHILNKLNLNVNFRFPTLPDFNFDLPQLPAVNCNALRSYAAR